MKDYWDQGYVHIKGLFGSTEIEELRGHFTDLLDRQPKSHPLTEYRYKDVGTKESLHFVKWASASHAGLDQFRLHPKLMEVVYETLGGDLRQITNQMHLKLPGDGIGFITHQDCIFRKPDEAYRNLFGCFAQTGIAVDRATKENGCMYLYPKSHLGKASLMHFDEDVEVRRAKNDEVLRNLGEPYFCELEPGDFVMWNPYMVHGSNVNRSQNPRWFYINGFAQAQNCDHGMLVTRDRQALPLDLESELKWDQIKKKA